MFVLAATSRPDLVDAALLRPGRLDKWVYIDMPDESERKEILQVAAKDLEISDQVDFDRLARETECFTGADLQALVYSAQLDSIHERETEDVTLSTKRPLSMHQFEQALEKARPSISKKELFEYRRSIQRFVDFKGSGVDDLTGAKQQRVSLK